MIRRMRTWRDLHPMSERSVFAGSKYLSSAVEVKRKTHPTVTLLWRLTQVGIVTVVFIALTFVL